MRCWFQKGDKDRDKDKEKDRDRETEGVVAMTKDDSLEEIDQKDDGYIELVLRVLARMCDGQHMGLQVYLQLNSSIHLQFTIETW